MNIASDILGKSQKNEILLATAESLELWCKIMFPDTFNVPFSDAIHQPLFEALDDRTAQLVAIAAPRGCGKSSIINKAYSSREMLLELCNYMVPVSASETLAQQHSENLKKELKFNHRIQYFFGEVIAKQSGKEMWTAQNTRTKDFPTLIFPRGMGQSPRGLLNVRYRPDLLMNDDIEKREDMLSDVMRNKAKQYLFDDLFGCVDLRSKSWRLILIGTVLHDDSLLSQLLKDPNWKSVRLSLCDESFKSLWPEKVDQETLDATLKMFKDAGMLGSFYREYMNVCRVPDDAPFPDTFEYFTAYEIASNPRIKFIVIVDPAKTAERTSCETGIVCAGVDTLGNKVYVAEVAAGRWHVDQAFDEAMKMAKRWGAKTLGYETTGLGEFAAWPIINELSRSGEYMEFVELKAKRGTSQYLPVDAKKPEKAARIGSALVPLYRKGLVKHNRENLGISRLETQLRDFPGSSDIDIVDALSYIVQFMSQSERVMVRKDFAKGSDKSRVSAYLDELKEREALERLMRDSPSQFVTNWQV